jgi:hypothetical protein
MRDRQSRTGPPVGIQGTSRTGINPYIVAVGCGGVRNHQCVTVMVLLGDAELTTLEVI